MNESASGTARGQRSGPAAVMRRDLGLEHVEDVRVIDRRIDQVNTRIIAMTKQRDTTLIRIYGIGWIAAAVIIAETVDVRRFPTKHHFASYTGTAPIDVSSGDNYKHRLSRSGNRRLNWAIHVAAITQIRNQTPGREFYDRKIAEGKTTQEALRALKRRINDAVWKQLQLDLEANPPEQDLVWPRWPSSRGTYRHYNSFDTPRANGKPGRPKARTAAGGPGVWPHQESATRRTTDHATGITPTRRPPLLTPDPPPIDREEPVGDARPRDSGTHVSGWCRARHT
jgi:Transposase IS116/IS110/IS902 family